MLKSGGFWLVVKFADSPQYYNANKFGSGGTPLKLKTVEFG